MRGSASRFALHEEGPDPVFSLGRLPSGTTQNCCDKEERDSVNWELPHSRFCLDAQVRIEKQESPVVRGTKNQESRTAKWRQQRGPGGDGRI
jgi:hypothetical protein